MEGPATGKKFTMKGHTLPGINQRSEGNTDLPDGRSASSAFQDKELWRQAQEGGASKTTVDKIKLREKVKKENIKTGEEKLSEDLTTEEREKVEGHLTTLKKQKGV